ncbi:hypothetical protein J437_LFUL004357 [Ladona fulva]|uniref:RNB domain-containing protein n=1 Tax=Ladona fulva TaxID=123851 RepID=A0A8K0P080_LADFU|nr:hypothetical protein J437_LFUL004357 [Ladona fulva]
MFGHIRDFEYCRKLGSYMEMDSADSVFSDKSPHKGNESKAVEKDMGENNPIPADNAKKKRKRRIRKNISKDNVASDAERASQSDTVKSSLETKKLQSKEEAAGNSAVEKMTDQENHSKDVGKFAKKGRNAKKKAVAGNSTSQVSGAQVPVLNTIQSNVSPKYTPPKHLRNVPAGVQPMFYVRQSPKKKLDSPKQEKFLPYWTAQQVEAGLKFGSLISGIIRINPRNYQKAYITPADDEDSKDILIDGIIDRNRALEGDEVAVKLYDESKWQVDENGDGEQGIQKTGMVVYILAMNHNRCTVGYLKLVNQAANSTPTKSGRKSLEAASSSNSSSNALSPNIQATVGEQSNQNSSGSLESPKTSAEAKNAPYKMPDKVLFSPRDARMPRMWVKTSQLPSGSPTDLNPTNCLNHLFLVCIHEWSTQPIANGKLLTYIGEADEVDTETVALLLEHGLDVTPYPNNIFTLPPFPYEIPEKELKERLDLRGTLIFTIDPETAKDLDDALSVKEIGEGLLEVGVHIADPSFFLEENSPLDLLVRERATSIYLVQNVFHMLPKELCLLCSLLPGEDKLAFSLIMTVDTKTWKVVSHDFSRSVVNSSAQLSYEHAQAFIKDPGCINSIKDFPVVHNGYTVEDLCRAVNLIWPFSAALRERRFSSGGCETDSDEIEYKGGALRINQPKLCFKLDGETCMPQEVFLYENKESNNLIEELMLLANILTAQRLASMFPKHAFLRRHCRPKMNMLNNLAQILMRYGIHLDTSAAGALNASLERYGATNIESIKDVENGNTENVIRNISCDNTHLTRGANKKEVENSTDSCTGVDTHSSKDSVLEIQQDILVSTSTSSSVNVSTIEESLRTLVVRENESNSSSLEDEGKINDDVCLSNAQSISDTSNSSLEKKFEGNAQTGGTSFISSLRKVPSEEELGLARGLVLNHLCAKPMMRAEYYCYGAKLEESIKGILQSSTAAEEVEVYTHHYALNVPLYTHFTSPIRRYADIMVHRLLAASLGYQPPPLLDPKSLQSIASNCNKQKYGAKKASEASNELFFRLWVRLQVEKDACSERTGNKPKTGDSEERRSEGGLREMAVVVNAKDYSFDAILLRFGVVVRVYVNKLPAAVKHLKKHGSSVISIQWFKPGEKTVSIDSPVQDITTFSIVKLEIYYSYTVRRIRAELLNPFTP